MAVSLRFHSHPPSLCSLMNAKKVLGSFITDIIIPSGENWQSARRHGRLISFKGGVQFVQTSCQISVPGTSPRMEEKVPSNILRDKKAVPDADPPNIKDVNLLYQFFEQSTKLMVLTGAGISTECGIPDYRRSFSAQFEPEDDIGKGAMLGGGDIQRHNLVLPIML